MTSTGEPKGSNAGVTPRSSSGQSTPTPIWVAGAGASPRWRGHQFELKQHLDEFDRRLEQSRGSPRRPRADGLEHIIEDVKTGVVIGAAHTVIATAGAGKPVAGLSTGDTPLGLVTSNMDSFVACKDEALDYGPIGRCPSSGSVKVALFGARVDPEV
ncbi:hypothetical protein HK405_012587 [Cladochytrium tenue]|nr:hypothetical protein HK405_012587 [Cladochytrium tenue]